MNLQHQHRLAIVAALVLSGMVATSTLLACSADTTTGAADSTATSAIAIEPSGVRWQEFQRVALPVADQGPQHTDGPVASGFERSPAGAALAAIHATVRMSIAPDSQWPVVGQRMLAPGPGRDAWATARAQISITTPVEGSPPIILGYRVTRYALDATDIEIYSLHPDNSVTRNSARVLWQRDDWRLQLSTTSAISPVSAVPAPPADMVAFTPR